MKISKQTQKAGDDALQIQTQTTNIYNGISEQRAHEICREECRWALQAYTQDAYQTANARVERLEDRLIPRIMRLEDSLLSFADPAFQILLRKAQQTAACTEREDDYDMLTELLICHIQKGQNRKNRVGVERAIEIIDKIDNDALCALTILYAMNSYLPTSGDCKDGLKTLDSLFGKLMYINLPQGSDWIEHLGLLGAIRISDFGKMKQTVDCYIERLPGYSCVGIKKDSENHKKALAILENADLDKSILRENECLEGFLRLPVTNKESISLLIMNGSSGNRSINQKEIVALEQIWDLYSDNANDKKKVKENFANLLNSFESLQRLCIWRDAIHGGYIITPIGKVLAYTNARRCDPSLPALSL